MPLHSPETLSLIRSHPRNIFPRDVRTSSREDCRKSCLAVQEVGPASSGEAPGPTRPDGYKRRTETLPPLAQSTRPMPPSPALRIAQPSSAPQTWSSVLGILRRLCSRAFQRLIRNICSARRSRRARRSHRPFPYHEHHQAQSQHRIEQRHQPGHQAESLFWRFHIHSRSILGHERVDDLLLRLPLPQYLIHFFQLCLRRVAGPENDPPDARTVPRSYRSPGTCTSAWCRSLSPVVGILSAPAPTARSPAPKSPPKFPLSSRSPRALLLGFSVVPFSQSHLLRRQHRFPRRNCRLRRSR